MLSMAAFLLLMSCEKEESVNSNQEYRDSSGISLDLSNCKWFVTKTVISSNNSFANVNLSIAGTTNADKVSIETFGDGLTSEQVLTMDKQKNFKTDSIVISFRHFTGAFPTEEFESHTRIFVYKGLDTMVVDLKSHKLKY